MDIQKMKILSKTAIRLILVLLICQGWCYGMYNPEQGRFMQRDKMGYRDGMDLYGYVQERPLNRLDALGFFTIEAVGTPVANLTECSDGKKCISGYWMSTALRMDEKEQAVLDDVDNNAGLYSVMNKTAYWYVKDCKDSSYIISPRYENVSFVRQLERTTSTFEEMFDDLPPITIQENKAAGPTGVRISTRQNDNKWKNSYRSPYYAALIDKNFVNQSNCCSKGAILINTRFSLYSTGDYTVFGDADYLNKDYAYQEYPEILSTPEYLHPDYKYPKWNVPDFGGKLISEGYFKVKISWNCNQEIDATIISNVDYSDAGGRNNRTGREEDWSKYNDMIGVSRKKILFRVIRR